MASRYLVEKLVLEPWFSAVSSALNFSEEMRLILVFFLCPALLRVLTRPGIYLCMCRVLD